MSTTGEAYTHRAWMIQAESVMETLATLEAAADAMLASLIAQEAGQAQLDGVQRWQAAISDAMATGSRLISDTDHSQRPVGEAIAAAGGPAEVAAKSYYGELA